MGKNGIKEYKLAVKKCLMKKYNMFEIDAHIAVRDSKLISNMFKT